MTDVTATTKNTIGALLGTVSTAANVTISALNSANTAARDLQERTEAWAANARIDRKLASGSALKQAKIRYAKNQADQVVELNDWLKQNPSREPAFTAALAEADALLA